MDPRDLFSRLEAKYGLPEYLDGAWAIESGRGKNMRNRSTGAAGHFQFMPDTAKRYGLTNPNDLSSSAEAAARLAYDSASRLKKLGAPVTSGNLYLMHQQGRGGASALLSKPEAKAIDVLTDVYGSVDTARRAITLNGGNLSWTAGEFANHIASAYYTKAGKEPPKTARPQPKPTAAPVAQSTGFLPDLVLAPRRAAASLKDLLESLDPRARQTTSDQAPAATPSNARQMTSFGDVILSLIK